MTKATVLYEDSQMRGVTNFGPHVLLLKCVADQRLQLESEHELSFQVAFRCFSGVDKLIPKAHLVASRATRVLAPDDDKIREHLGLLPQAAREQVIQILSERTDSEPDNVVLIVRNMDDVARAAAECSGLQLEAGKPALRDRDRACHRLAVADLTARAQFLGRCPSFKELVGRVCALLEA
ncbi:MAG: hypothetical protein GQE15_07290 [Archangiaceae bacterium]|nr:hypothetical protein [Archangiaceae bacterium]